MKWMLDLPLGSPPALIRHQDGITLIGSCFTRNIGQALEQYFFNVSYNPTGILFDPLSVCRHIRYLIGATEPDPEDYLFHNEIWQHPDFHSDFSAPDKNESTHRIATAIEEGKRKMLASRHLIITLGSAFAYRFTDSGRWVANCHRIDAQNYEKVLLDLDTITVELESLRRDLKARLPELQLILTVSPVRHIRDGVVANNRSKARLIESVHKLCERHPEDTWYFPSYEWVIDVLRDYRWYDIDLVHPNYAATQSIFEQFCNCALDQKTALKLPELKEIYLGMNHRPRFPETLEHQKFVTRLEEKKQALLKEMPWINWDF